MSHPSSGSGEKISGEEDPFPALTLGLSQGTIDAILAETGSLVTSTQEEDDARPSAGSKRVPPEEFAAEVSVAEAARTHDIPHSIRIETETFQVIPDGEHGLGRLERLETASQSVLDSVLGQADMPPPPKTRKTGAGIPPPEPSKGAPLTRRPIRAVRLRSATGSAMAADFARNDTKPLAQPQSAPAISDFPSNTPYPGKYEFEIFFSKAQESESKKTISYIYSVEEAKLYVRMRVHCPVHFKTNAEPPAGTIVRAMVIYSRPQDVGDVVRRCMNHTMEDKDQMAYPDHLVRCHNPRGVEYSTTGPSQRHSVAFPWDPPPPGSAHITGIYEFMCFSSCSGTINRRPTQMIFTLECHGEILGRQVIELRICACPGRDIVLSESGGTLTSATGGGERKRKGRPAPSMASPFSDEGDFSSLTTNLTSVEPLGKKHRDNEVYTVQVRGRELYKIVMTIVRNYEISRRYEELAPLFKQMKDLQALSGGALPNLPASLQSPLGHLNNNNNNGAGGSGGEASHHTPVSSNASHNGGGDTPPLAPQHQDEEREREEEEARAFPSLAGQHLRSLLPDQLTPDTPIYDWLVSQELQDHGPAFASLGFHTLQDLEQILSMELLEKMGLALEDRERLFGAFIQYKSMRQASQLSGLSSFSGLSQSSLSQLDNLESRVGGRSEGFRIAKTKITSMYKMPKRRAID